MKSIVMKDVQPTDDCNSFEQCYGVCYRQVHKGTWRSITTSSSSSRAEHCQSVGRWLRLLQFITFRRRV